MEIKDISIVSPHGGSLRATIGRIGEGAQSDAIQQFVDREKKITSDFIDKFQKTIFDYGHQFKTCLEQKKESGEKIIGYGAPARLATITNFCDVGPALLDFVVDDSPLKQNRFSPGKHIPIVESSVLETQEATTCVVFAYEYFKSIHKKTESYDLRYFKAIPFTEIEQE